MRTANPVIEGGYLRDILAQPRALEDTLAGLDDFTLPPAPFHRTVLTAMGGSYFALYPLHLRLLRRGLHSLLIETAELLYYAPSILDAGTLLIVVSQSGRSAEIVRILDVKQPGCFTLAVTNTPGSPLAARADATVLTRAGEEFTVSCKTYVAALLALQWVGDRLAGIDPMQSKGELARAAPAAAAYLKDWRGHVESAAAELAGLRHLFYLGRGDSLATAWIAGLTTKESAHVHAEGMSAAAFRHGPFEMLGPGLYALVFEGGTETAPLNRALVGDIRIAGARAALAGEDAETGLFRLPRVPASLRPIVEVLPVQMMTLALAAMSGREAGKFERASKVTATE
jgi:glucosamine--fructose-6-phosphate aminotransferase (isomerizing)